MTIEALQRNSEKIFPEGEIRLDRVPSELKSKIWNAKTEDLAAVIMETNLRLVQYGQSALSDDEIEDALDGNYFMNFLQE